MNWFDELSRQACAARGWPEVGVVVWRTQPPIFCGWPRTKWIASHAVQRPAATLPVSVTTTPGGGAIGTGIGSGMLVLPIAALPLGSVMQGRDRPLAERWDCQKRGTAASSPPPRERSERRGG